ncbi:MAG: ParB/RepB/Spo0J family partition protein [Gammaproteobacteria bacterium]
MSKRKSLGTGLDALLGTGAVEKSLPQKEDDKSYKNIPIVNLHPCQFQPRKDFKKEQLQELASSIKEQGIIQPIIVRVSGSQANYFEIIAGERRWRAAQLAGLETLPAIVRKLSDDQVMAMTLIENIQREDLNAIEEAQALKRLVDDLGMSHEEVGKVVGMSRESVSNMIRLIDLPEAVRAMVVDGDLSMGHARALLGVGERGSIISLANRVKLEGLSVRKTERLVQFQKKKTNINSQAHPRNPDLLILERELGELLGSRVTIKSDKRGGTLTFKFFSNDELQGIIERLRR